MKNLAIIVSLIVLGIAGTARAQFYIIQGQQGGTGIGSVLVGDVGKCLQVSDDSPFTWTVATCGSSGDPNVILKSVGQTTYLAASSTVYSWYFDQGFVSAASSTVDSTLKVSGALTASSTLQVTGTGTFFGNLGVSTSSSLGQFAVQSTDGSILMGNGTFVGKSVTTDSGIEIYNSGIRSGLFTEVNGSILSLGVNVGQIGQRDNTKVGGILRFDTRSTGGAPNAFTIIGAPIGTDLPEEYQRFYINLENGKTGIGTTSPGAFFGIQGSIISDGFLHIGDVVATGTVTVGTTTSLGQLTAANSLNGGQIAIDSDNARGSSMDFYASTTLVGKIGSAGVIQGANSWTNFALGSAAGRGINFYTNGVGTVAATLTTARDLGVGTTSPTQRISTNQSIYATQDIIAERKFVGIGGATSTIGTSLALGTTTSRSTLEIEGSFGCAVASTSAATFNATQEHCTILGNAISNAITVNLPKADYVLNRKYTIQKTDSSANVVTVQPFSGDSIWGAATLEISFQNESYTVQSDGGSHWR